MNPSTDADGNQCIDLTRAADVAYWCRIFDLSPEQLRDAVHHAGHQVPEVWRYLRRSSVAGQQAAS
jgi:hypothetical protein